MIHVDRDAWKASLLQAIDTELNAVGLQGAVSIQSAGPVDPDSQPTIAVFLGSAAASTDAASRMLVRHALDGGTTVIPVVEDLDNYVSSVPIELHPINGWRWDEVDPTRLARFVLRQLGIEEQQRRVFISHKREDGLLAAEQLYDHLQHNGFEPFIDRFGIRAGDSVQDRITQSLERCAFLLLLETPRAHESAWVYDEVEYALSHVLGMHIVTWPGASQVAGSNRLPRQLLASPDLTLRGGQFALSAQALDAVLAEVEAAQAAALVRRRRQLLRNVEDAAEVAHRIAIPLPDWRLLIETPAGSDIVGVSAHTPRVKDLFALDRARRGLPSAANAQRSVLVHGTPQIDPEERDLLVWSIHSRPMTLVWSNSIGGYW